MTPPKNLALHQSLELDGDSLSFHFVNSGVPHVVIETGDLDRIDLPRLGAAIRHHPHFAPAGTNVNFIQLTGPDQLRVRTYERGVEAETLACGTGMVACGLVAGELGRVSVPVRITCASGDVLGVDYHSGPDGPEAPTLTGPAVHVFRGEIEL